jgi:hypothetical protein
MKGSQSDGTVGHDRYRQESAGGHRTAACIQICTRRAQAGGSGPAPADTHTRLARAAALNLVAAASPSRSSIDGALFIVRRSLCRC